MEILLFLPEDIEILILSYIDIQDILSQCPLPGILNRVIIEGDQEYRSCELKLEKFSRVVGFPLPLLNKFGAKESFKLLLCRFAYIQIHTKSNRLIRLNGYFIRATVRWFTLQVPHKEVLRSIDLWKNGNFQFSKPVPKIIPYTIIWCEVMALIMRGLGH